MEILWTLAHDLTSCSAVVGAMALPGVCGQLEERARQGDQAAVRDLLVKFHRYARLAASELRTELPANLPEPDGADGRPVA